VARRRSQSDEASIFDRHFDGCGLLGGLLPKRNQSSALHDYTGGKGYGVQMKALFCSVIAIAYWFWPLDLIPDVPPIGYVDDFAVGLVSAAIALRRGKGKVNG